MNPLRSIGRRWWVVVIGLLLSVVFYGLMLRSDGVYTAKTDVHFTAPGDSSFGSSNDRLRGSVVGFVAVVERVANDGRPADRLASTTATQAGAGVTRGTTVQLPNTGGQWQNSFGEPVLEIEVVGPDEGAVTTQLARTIRRVERIAEARQDGVPSGEMITTSSAPAELVPVTHLTRTPSTSLRALLALVTGGFAVSAALAVALDRALLARRRRRPTVDSQAQPITWLPERHLIRP